MTSPPEPCERINGAKRLILEAFNAARDGYKLSPGELALIVNETLRSANEPRPASPLPAAAPETWKERDLNRRENAPAFIRRVYGPWIGHGLTRAALSELDHDLYRALGVWLTRHPDDPLASQLPRRSDLIDGVIEDLSAVYPVETLRKLGHAIDARIRRHRLP